jgi:hypothetical protein
MARIPILQEPGQLNTGNQTIRTPDLPAVTNASMGKAIGNLGNVVFDIAEKAKRANDVTKLTEASLAMNKAQMDFATFQQSPEGQDEKNWLPKWQSLQNDIKAQFDQAELTPEARMQFTDNLSNWATRGTINVQAQAFKQAGVRMDALGEAAKRQSFNTGDTKIYDDHVDATVNAGLVLPEVGANLKAQNADEVKRKRIADLNAQVPLLAQAVKNGDKSAIEKLAEINDEKLALGDVSKEESNLYNQVVINGAKAQQEVQDLMVIANDNPDTAAELAVAKEREGKITGQDRVNIEREAYQSKAFKRRDAVNKYKERLALHDIPSPEELQQNTSLTDFDRASIAALATGSVNDPAEFESALTAAMSFDSGKYVDPRDAITAATQMEASFEARFDGPYLDSLRAELTKRRDRDPALPTAETDIGPAMQQLEDSIKQGGLFPLERPVLQDGKPVMQDPKKIGFVTKPGWMWGESQIDVKENEGKPVPLTEPDKVAIEKAAAIQREIRRAIESEVKAGKLKDQSEITARMFDLATIKGIKIKPVKPNSMLPALQSDGMSDEAFNETLKKYGK